MSETFKFNPQMPVGYEALDSIEIIEKNGSIKTRGSLELGKGQTLIRRSFFIPDFNVLMGMSDEQGPKPPQEEPGIIGAAKQKASAAVTSVKEKLSNTPTNSQQPDPNEQTGPTPDIEAVVEQIVSQRMAEINSRLEVLETQNQQLLEANQHLTARNHELESELENLRQQPPEAPEVTAGNSLDERLDEEFGDRWVPRQENISVIRFRDDGYLDDGWITAGQPYFRDGTWYIKIRHGDDEQDEELGNLARARTVVPDPQAPHSSEEPAETPQMGWRERTLVTANRWASSPFTRRAATTYEYDDHGRVTNETRQSRGISALGAGALAVGAVIIWELIEHKFYGHSSSREARLQAQQYAADLRLHEKAEKGRQVAELKAVNIHEQADKLRDAQQIRVDQAVKAKVEMLQDKMTAQHIHAHKHDLGATNGVLKAVNRGNNTLLQHSGIYGSETRSNVDFSSYRYPWDYTRSETLLRSWAAKASNAGHSVRWLSVPGGREALEVDGSTNTQKVLQIVTQYK